MLLATDVRFPAGSLLLLDVAIEDETMRKNFLKHRHVMEIVKEIFEGFQPPALECDGRSRRTSIRSTRTRARATSGSTSCSARRTRRGGSFGVYMRRKAMEALPLRKA